MKTFSHYFIFIFLFFTTFYSFSQRKCAFQHTHEEEFEEKIQRHIQQKRNSRIEADEEIYSIPVVVHIIHNNANGTIGGTGNSNISDQQIFSQIEVLNEDFRRLNADTNKTPDQFKSVAVDTKIEFCLANRSPEGEQTSGITRTYSTDLPFNPYSNKDNQTLKSLAYWNSEEYLNIWVTKLSENVLGYAQFPSNTSLLGLAANEGSAITDGVVITHTSFGNRTGTASSGVYSYGRTVTHEIGHWLGLIHIWGNTESCTSSDYCNDTPEQSNSTSNCPNELPFTCDNYNMISNYMDYTNDVCMNLFTKDQKDRMRSVLEIAPRRKTLFTSLGCCGSKKSVDFPFVENFENNLDDNGWTIGNGWKQEGNILVSSETAYNSITSPYLNGNNVSNPEFQLGIKGTINGKLVILYEVICNPIWDTLLIIDKNNFTDWRNLFFEIPKLANKDAIRLQIHSFGGNKISLNNIQLYQKSDNLDFIVYPNPLSQEQLTVKTLLAGEHLIKVEVYDYFGRKVYENDKQTVLGDIFHIDNLDLVSGSYIIRLSNDTDTFIKQFVVNRE